MYQAANFTIRHHDMQLNSYNEISPTTIIGGGDVLNIEINTSSWSIGTHHLQIVSEDLVINRTITKLN